MEKVKAEKSWVSKTMLKRMLVVWLALILISILFYKITVVVIISGILSTLMLLMILFFSYAYYKLSPGGGDLQSQVSALATNKIDVKSTGRLLDIGCGSGILAVELAVKCPALKIQGIDYWGRKM